MNKKIFGLASFLMIFAASSVFCFSPAGKKYRVIEMNGEDISGYKGLVDVFISFTDNTLTLETNSFGSVDKQSEKYTYNDKTKVLKETYDGGSDQFTVEVTADGIILSNSAAYMVLVDITNGEDDVTLGDVLNSIDDYDYSDLYNDFSDYYDYY